MVDIYIVIGMIVVLPYAPSQSKHGITLETTKPKQKRQFPSFLHTSIPNPSLQNKKHKQREIHIKPSINLGINLCGPLQASRAIQPPSNVERKREKRGCSARAREHVHLPVVVQVKASFRRSSRVCTKKKEKTSRVTWILRRCS